MVASVFYLYASFAVLAAAVNFLVQHSIIRYLGHDDLAVQFAILFGTGAGLVTKYILDKVFVFRYSSSGVAHEGRTFLLYALTGVVTTLIFWGCEWGAWAMCADERALYAGGALGLFIGYMVKYRLDKAFVFTSAR